MAVRDPGGAPPFRRVLVANRGEIAVRVIAACRELGIESVAVYSDADARARHTALADVAVRIGPAPALDSYLSIPAILEAAHATGADAVHPGYGFLSENADFASACADAGLTFVGPPAAVITRMGSKIAAREVAAEAGVPVVPGATPATQSDEAIAAAATALGLPVLLKPSEGGGGIGMVAVYDAGSLVTAIQEARREATAAFGDGTLYVERLLERPRHVEFQILADHHGAVLHLFERECSLQRRHQKVMEESPSPALGPDLRARMGAAAVALARAAGYRNAGTVEFLVEGSGDHARFYFLEMNTRLQVEHPVTEQVTGLDLVRAQLMVAAGAGLPWAQSDVTQRGHAIELRIYAEDPARNDLPQAGPLRLYREPALPGVRIDAGVVEGDEVSVYYDPLLAKLIASGETRDLARRRALAALRRFPILGIRTNVGLLAAVLEHPDVVAGRIVTGFLTRESDRLRSQLGGDPPPEALAVAKAHRATAPGRATDRAGAASPARRDPWTDLRGARV
jgi:acetyl-CoA/propionyl-CoA carboxylase biotin carboxyl carrier protein